MEGNTYSARIHYTCKKMAGGGCAISTFSVLSFKKDTVEIYERIVAACTPEELESAYSHNGEKEKVTYIWRKDGDAITIEGFTEFGTFVLQGDTLHSSEGTDEENNKLMFEREG